MAIEPGRGDLLRADVDAVVNPVNTVGVMGKGLARQVRDAFPDVFAAYAAACARGEVTVGRVHVVVRSTPPRWVLNLPTKTHWRQPAQLGHVRAGLVDLIAQVRALELGSIAVPALGCGLGGLAWDDVRPLIVDAFAAVPAVRVVLFAPTG